jgi:hypothetical protein
MDINIIITEAMKSRDQAIWNYNDNPTRENYSMLINSQENVDNIINIVEFNKLAA